MSEYRIIRFLDKFVAFSWRSSPVVISLGLGASTAFFLRDELNTPTYMHIQKAYLLNQSRVMREPSIDVLKVIDPTFAQKLKFHESEKIRSQNITYDEHMRQKQQQQYMQKMKPKEIESEKIKEDDPLNLGPL